MEQAAPDPERLLQPAPLEPLSHPDAGLESVVGEEAKGARDESPGDGTVRRRGGRDPPGLGRGLEGRMDWFTLTARVGSLGREAPR